MDSILAATDFSGAGNRAVLAAAAWARREQCALRIVHVMPPRRLITGLWRRSDPEAEAACVHALAALQKFAAALGREGGLRVTTDLLQGSASGELARAAGGARAGLLVIGALGERDGLMQQPGFGGTAAKLLARVELPLLLVRRDSAEEAGDVLAAIDLSPASASVLAWAGRAARGERVCVYHAYEVPFTRRLEAYGLAGDAIDVYTAGEHERRAREAAALASRAGLRASEVVVERGDAATLLMAQIARLDARLVVLGKRGAHPRRAASTQYGSVCRFAAFSAPTDVLVVPPAAA
jgi:nucleotide-binding universal stress UspA family protein